MHHFRFNLRRHHHVFQGFTLIELLVVMSIIGVLSTVVFAGIQTARERGRVAAGIKFEGYTYRAYYDDVVASWDFESVNGTQVSDSSGNGNHLTLINTPTVDTDTPNGFGNSLEFDIKALDEAATQSVILKPPTNEFTVSFWFKTSTIDHYRIISNTFALAAGKWYVAMQSSPTIIAAVYRSGSGAPTINGPQIRVNSWMHVAVTCSSTNRWALYIDGNLFNSISAGACAYNNTAPVRLGYPAYSSAPSPILNVDNVRIYKKALPTASIQEIYLAEKDEFLPVAGR